MSRDPIEIRARAPSHKGKASRRLRFRIIEANLLAVCASLHLTPQRCLSQSRSMKQARFVPEVLGAQMAQRERRIREIAYLLWEQEGRPHGQSERFWHAAVAQFETEILPAESGHEAAVKTKPETLGSKSRAPAEAKPVQAEVEKPVPAAKPKAAKASTARAKTAEAPAAVKAADSEPPAKSTAKSAAKSTAKPRTTATKRKPTV